MPDRVHPLIYDRLVVKVLDRQSGWEWPPSGRWSPTAYAWYLEWAHAHPTPWSPDAVEAAMYRGVALTQVGVGPEADALSPD